MGSHECSVMGLESQAISVQVLKLIITIFSKACNNLAITTNFLYH